MANVLILYVVNTIYNTPDTKINSPSRKPVGGSSQLTI